MKSLKYSLILALFSAPVLALAQAGQFGRTRGLFQSALDIVRNILIPLAFTIALLYFFWGVAMYIKSEGQGKDDGKRIMIWGVVALFVMSSVWGLVYFLQDELLGDNIIPSSLPIPTVGSTP